MTDSSAAGTTFWLAPGTYHLGTGRFDQVQPKNGDTFLGAPGAVIDGQHVNLYAFAGSATGVTVKYLTIQNFGAPGDNNNEGVVNHDAASGWVIAHNTVQTNAGAGVFLGNNDVISYNCLRNNGQYGFSSYLPDGVSNLTLNFNEISGNNADNWEVRQPGCGCTGGGKFWDTDGATVTNNYVHNNRGVGLWADTNNTGFLFQGNYISGNDDEGLMYEISYNAAILDNTFVRNAIVKGPTNAGFPASAIYLSEAGSDPRAGSTYGSSLEVAGNVFTDNWAGIVAWENADRFAGSPANSSTGIGTLVNPSVATLAACGSSLLIGKSPYIDDCRWKTQNVQVHNNTFTITPSNIGSSCTPANSCGFNGLFSNYGSYPSWSPYQGAVVENHITFDQNNRWTDNSYIGPWNFMIHEAGNSVPWATWRSSTYGQDAGSTLN
ncbi:MAG: right-handed parallel beta-helix repeat-containing protein [Actinomycetota bacterium]|nr:right-handed parallel beta-helix repeat-containing protein [Actinomycetota bacterium]